MTRNRTRNQRGWLKETETGYWQANWEEYYTDPVTNKRKRRHRTALLGKLSQMRKLEARAALERLVNPVNRTPDLMDGSVTFRWFVEQRFIPVKVGDWSEPTLLGNQKDLRLYILPTLGDRQLQEIDIDILKRWLGGLGKHGKNLSVNVVKRAKTLVSSILEYACERGFLVRNPCKTRLYKRPKCKVPHRPVARLAEIGLLFNTVTDVRNRAILLVAGHGLTASECFGLTWEWIHEDDEFPYLEVQNSAYRGQFYQGDAKNEERHRRVSMDPELTKAMECWRATAQNTAAEALVFPGRGGCTMWSGTWLQDHIQPIARSLGIKSSITFQLLRRSFITWTNNRGAERLTTVQAAVGHTKGSKVTEQVYDQPVPEKQAALMREYGAAVRAAAKAAKLKMLTKSVQ